ncbi:unnamed protein product [Camellia sinensis]|uniref:Uncharacterized protein n=1 Tax=Camellia lanceoleosa TaxID=1840588 RepID=A0ACC0I8H9_9ERIC|nr:uncharacterized protein LOC114277087 [Camellia sinensis]KAI8021989.1 hypothetical protein LOK49_LG03G00271 [Camellia lanceoleosa]
MASMAPSFSLLFVVVTLFFASGAEAKFKGINSWCRTSDYKLLCTRMVNGAATQEAAIANAVQATLQATTRLRPQLDLLGEALSNLPGLTKDSVITTCRESFENAEDNLKEALDYLKASDRYTVVDRIQTAESSFLDCVTAIKEMGGATSLGKTSKILYRYSSNCMAAATQT